VVTPQDDIKTAVGRDRGETSLTRRYYVIVCDSGQGRYFVRYQPGSDPRTGMLDREPSLFPSAAEAEKAARALFLTEGKYEIIVKSR
jgi:hypothetical protein